MYYVIVNKDETKIMTLDCHMVRTGTEIPFVATSYDNAERMITRWRARMRKAEKTPHSLRIIEIQ